MVSYEYIAGFFDGEGYCSIMKSSAGGHSRSPYYVIASMANTHKGVLDEIQKLCGGKVIFHAGGAKGFMHYRLTFYTRQAVNFLKAIRPYLVIKQVEADLAIAFDDYIRSTSYYFDHGRKKMTSEELAVRHEYYLKMKSWHGNKGANKENVPLAEV